MDEGIASVSVKMPELKRSWRDAESWHCVAGPESAESLGYR